MTKAQYIQELKDMDSEYLYRDYGYGGFDSNGDFIVLGEKVTLTFDDVKEMFQKEVGGLLAELRNEFAN